MGHSFICQAKPEKAKSFGQPDAEGFNQEICKRASRPRGEKTSRWGQGAKKETRVKVKTRSSWGNRNLEWGGKMGWPGSELFIFSGPVERGKERIKKEGRRKISTNNLNSHELSKGSKNTQMGKKG